ncbi:protein PALE CRESS, chloroplastic isoform X2 [Cryptomeria japonica]|uniref:protein PALE CRESS, chloroplastic isoform X2 n=1 Tax=Cryptomeria japonica TaxID=3369 RepID=UPI0027DA4DE4|nr:protein PALE CRESS, chloroplastic isoform X2 [Cryptomeria japonica]
MSCGRVVGFTLVCSSPAPTLSFTGVRRVWGKMHKLGGRVRARVVDDALPQRYYDDEWQAKQRKKTKELQRRRKQEEAEEEKKVEEMREIASRFSGYPEKEIRRAKHLVSNFIKSGEDVEEMIVEAADNGELTDLVLFVIWNRLDLAHRDAELLKRRSSPAMQLLNELLNLNDGSNEDEWLQECRICMLNTFPSEDPFTIFAPAGMDISKDPIDLLPEQDDTLLRIDFIRETDELLEEQKLQTKSDAVMGLDPESIAISLKLQEKERTLQQVKALRDLAISLKW